MRSVFAGIGNAPMPNSGIYFKDGTYLVEIMACRQGASRVPGKGDYCIVECTILEVLVDYEGSNKIGERVNWVVMMRWGETALSNLKGFIAAALSSDEGEEIDPEIINEEIADQVFGGTGDDDEHEADEEMMKGIKLQVVANTVLTKKEDDFTKVVWFADFVDLDDEEEEEDEDIPF